MMDAMIALTTTSFVLAPVAVVGTVLAWAESRARRREATVARQSSLIGAFLAGRDGCVYADLGLDRISRGRPGTTVRGWAWRACHQAAIRPLPAELRRVGV